MAEIDKSSTLSRKLTGGDNFGSVFLKHSISQGLPFEAQGEALRNRHQTQVDATGGMERRVAAGANLAVQRDGSFKFAGPRGFARQLEQNVKRGKVRQGINARGEKAIKNQQLKDRIGIARQTLGRRGQLMQSSADSAVLRAGGDAAVQAANDQVKAAGIGAVGAIAGGALRGFGNMFDTGSLSEGIMDQQQDVDSFFGAQGSDVGGLDNIFDGGFNFNTGSGTMVG